ncbi:unnamed protein product [Adineta steineri]|uniref:GST N-terminal domain-containing protein n=1 Tax=Adineta steineri TaxID=433720 RepID=A0A813UFG0_9BILA|nr:unnamed protein product [Adineta steineri]
MSTYKLYTFNSRSRAEIARLMFIAADQKFEDIRNSSVVQSQYSSALNSDSTTYCRIGTFILVVTTYSPNVLGTFAIISYGPGPIQFIIQQQ